MKSGCKLWVLSTLGILINAIYLSFAQAEVLPPGWKTECVGYYQLSLPAEVEVALLDMNDKGERTEYRFPDGREAYSRWFEGAFPVTTPQPLRIFEKKISAAEKNMMEFKKELLAEGKPNTANRIKFHSDLMPETFRLDWGGGASLYMQHGGRIYDYRIENPFPRHTKDVAPPPTTAEETKKLNELVARFLKRFRARALFEIPPESGWCIPYGFIAKEKTGHQSEYSAVAFRLKANPDVEIYFMDQDASRPPSGLTEKDVAKKELQLFWGNNYPAKELKLEGGYDGGFRAVNMAGLGGMATLVEITREYDAVDYGYTAYVKGNHVAEQDMHNLMLYVIRTAAHTRGTPMSKKDFIKLAEQIAASVKRRVPEQPKNSVK